MAITNFNRLINIKFLNQNGIENPALRIVTPLKGRKPNITINGLFAKDDSNVQFEVTVKNLYMDLTQRDYPIILVEAGYENQMRVAFLGEIVYAYRDAPGPESNVVFHCMYKLNVIKWASTPVSLSYAKGTSIREILSNISKTLGYTDPLISPIVGTMVTTTDNFLVTGTATEAVEKLRKEYNINITVTGNRIRAFTNEEQTPIGRFFINYLSSPPQLTGGGEREAVATINAPWVPGIHPGDAVSFNSKYYTTNVMLNSTKSVVTIKVLTLQMNFSTTGNRNQMTIMGTVV